MDDLLDIGLPVATAGLSDAREQLAKLGELSDRMRVYQAGRQADTDPTPAQQEAGNYRKGHVRLHGLDISIENPKGSVRSGVSADGKRWSNTMRAHYGYIKTTLAGDGDAVDVFIGDRPELELVFVVNQIDPVTRKFDEFKCMLGYPTEQAARQGYLANYDDGWEGLGSITPMTLPQFKWWLEHGDMDKPADPDKFVKRAEQRGHQDNDHCKVEHYTCGNVVRCRCRRPKRDVFIGSPCGYCSECAATQTDGANYRVAKSDVHGKGVRATRDLAKGDRIGLGIYESGTVSGQPRQLYITELTRYLNFADSLDDVNVHLREAGRNFDLVAARDIELGEELLASPGYVAEHSTMGLLSGDAELVNGTPASGIPDYDPDTDDEPDTTDAGDHQPTVAVDLDGTLAQAGEFDPDTIPPPRRGARQWMEAFKDEGCRIIVFTVRGNEKLVRKWLKQHSIPFDYINENPDQPKDASGKVIADLYIDDKGVDASDDWDEFGPEVLERLERA